MRVALRHGRWAVPAAIGALALAGCGSSGSAKPSGSGGTTAPQGAATSAASNGKSWALTRVAAGGISNPGQDGTGRPTIPVEITSVTVSAS